MLKVIQGQVYLVLVPIILIQLGIIVQQIWETLLKTNQYKQLIKKVISKNKSMQASRHQSPLKYRKSTVMQYAKNFYFSIAYSVIGKPSIWKSYHLDNILQNVICCLNIKELGTHSLLKRQPSISKLKTLV